MQALIAYLIVVVALIYAGWLFMPKAGRRWLIARLMAVSPPSLHARLDQFRADGEVAGCSTCKGCATDASTSPSIKTIQLHRH
jgi:hypothetical protein